MNRFSYHYEAALYAYLCAVVAYVSMWIPLCQQLPRVSWAFFWISFIAAQGMLTGHCLPLGETQKMYWGTQGVILPLFLVVFILRLY